MAADTLVTGFVLLFQMACVIFFFTYLFGKSRFYTRILEHRLSLPLQILLAVVFGCMSIFGMETGITFYTAYVNIRDFGPLAGGLACGPVVGVGAGIIGCLFRLSLGGTNVYAVAVAPLICGILGGLVYWYSGKKLLPTKKTIIVAILIETFVSALALAARYFMGDPAEVIATVLFNVAVPMIIVTAFATGIFTYILHNQGQETRLQKEKMQLEFEVESRKNLGAIINTIAYPVYVLGRDRHIKLVNDSFCRFTGKHRDDFIGSDKNPGDFFTKADVEHHREITDKVFRTGKSWEEEWNVTLPDGHQSIIQSALSMYRDTSGEEFIVVVIHEINELKNLQQELERSEEWYRTLFEHTRAATVILNKDGMIEHANTQFSLLSGYSLKEIEGIRGWQNFVHPEDYDRILRYHNTRRIDPDLVPGSYTQRIITRSREERTLQTLVGMVPGTEKSIVSFIDITEQKCIEDALKLANRKLNLLSSITRHDILNQILILRGYLTLLIKKADNPTGQTYSSKAYRATENIEHQLNFTRDYQDMGVQAPAWQDVSKMVITAKGQLVPSQVTVETEFSSLEILADPLLPKIFYNLIDNSIRYGGENMKSIRIETIEIPEGLIIRYEDNGAGISPEDKTHLFERGFGKNTGFGLFLSREILAITGIKITETGEFGKGARFDILIPRGMWRIQPERT